MQDQLKTVQIQVFVEAERMHVVTVQCSLQCQTDSAEECLGLLSWVILATDPSYSQVIRALLMLKCSSKPRFCCHSCQRLSCECMW